MIVPAHQYQEEIRAFIQSGLWNDDRRLEPAAFMGWATEDEGLVAGIALHNWKPNEGSIEITAYASRRDWLTRGVMAEVMDYVFDQLFCRVLTARTSERNAVVRRIFRSFGAWETVLPRMRQDDEGEAVAVLHRDDWLQSRFKR